MTVVLCNSTAQDPTTLMLPSFPNLTLAQVAIKENPFAPTEHY